MYANIDGTIIDLKVMGQSIGRVIWPSSERYMSPTEIEAKIRSLWTESKACDYIRPVHCFLDTLSDNGFAVISDHSDLTVELGN